MAKKQQQVRIMSFNPWFAYQNEYSLVEYKNGYKY